MRANPPEFEEGDSWSQYKKELIMWQKLTKVDKKQQGLAVALALPKKHKLGIRELVLEEIEIEKLEVDDGLKTLIDHLDKVLGKDDLTDSLEKFDEFFNYERESEQDIRNFISKFDQKYNAMAKKDMKLPSPIKAFMLIRKAKVTEDEVKLILTGVDYNEKDTLFHQSKSSLNKFKGEIVSSSGGATGGGAAIKLEPAFLAQNEEALLAAGYARQSAPYGGASTYQRNNGRRRGYGKEPQIAPP